MADVCDGCTRVGVVNCLACIEFGGVPQGGAAGTTESTGGAEK